VCLVARRLLASGVGGRLLLDLHHQAEAADRFSTVVVSHSTSGGTGSGLGSRFLEVTRDLYPGCVLVVSVA